MKPRTPQQLELACTITEATELHQQLTILEGRAASWEDAAHEWQRIAHILKRQYEEALAALRQVQSALTLAQVQITGLRFQLMSTEHETPAALPAWLPQALRQLLACAHPDKWSAGQDAATLAHELTVQVNALRQRLGEGH
jgi:hypothetical protein